VTTFIDDHDAIQAVIQLYVDGASMGDREKLRQAFHPDARMFGAMSGSRLDMAIEPYFDLAVKAPLDNKGGCRTRLVSVQQFGDAAVAILAEDGCWGAVSFVDIFSLSRFGEDWRIVNKTFTHTGGEAPRRSR